jgi:hypothetical protein
MSYKLTYFDVKGRGEAIRLIFAATGVKYADDRVPHQYWPKIKPSKNTFMHSQSIALKFIISLSITSYSYIFHNP